MPSVKNHRDKSWEIELDYVPYMVFTQLSNS